MNKRVGKIFSRPIDTLKKANSLPSLVKPKAKRIEDLIGFCIFTNILDGKLGHVNKISNTVFLIEYNNEEKHILKTYCYDKEELEMIKAAKDEFNLTVHLSKLTSHVVRGVEIKELSANGKVYIECLYEYGGSSLYDLIMNNKEIEIKAIIDWAKQSIEGLKAAENEGIFHSDIKPQNMVVYKNKLKVIDFGSSVNMYSKSHLLHTTVAKIRGVTPAYLPPEVFKEFMEGQFGLVEKGFKFNHNKADVYCWGMSFYQVLTQKSITELTEECNKYKRGNQDKYGEFINSVKEIGKKDKVVKGFVGILEATLAYDPKDRPTFSLLAILLSNLQA